MNEQLLDLYNSTKSILDEKIFAYNQSIIDQGRNLHERAANPLYLKVSEDYMNSPNKIMVLGQETNYWGSECGDNGAYCGRIEDVISIYDKFYLNKGIKGSKGPFWNEFRRIIVGTKMHHTSIVWNNINKVGRLGKGNVKAIDEIQFKSFRVVADEIRILKPKILVFLTGRNYDHFIQEQVGNFETVAIIENNIAEIQFQNEFADLKCYKTFHPNYLYFTKMNSQVMDRLIGEINRNYSNIA